MGIPFYFYQITKNYPEILEQPKKSCDVLFFDFNSLIHPCAHSVLEQSEQGQGDLDVSIISFALRYTESIIEKIRPSKVWITIDGVAPRAKMKQQRTRRFRSAYEREPGVHPKWDTNQITPGTNFMKKLSSALIKWQSEYQGCVVELDSWENPGEGEHKIYKTLKRESIKNKNVYIYGLDADLIILSLLETQNHLVLFRDDLNRDTPDYLDITMLKTRLMESLTGKKKVNERVLLDYTIMTCFLGNDFMDNVPTLPVSAINTLVNNYKRLNITLVNSDYTINYRNLLKLLSTCVGNESRIYTEIVKKEYTLDIPPCEQIFYYTDPELIHTKAKYYLFYGVSSVTDCCREYLTALNWVLGYYLGHSHNNWSFTCKYDCAPFVSDLVEFLQLSQDLKIKFVSDLPVSYKQQLFMVLPKISLLEMGDPFINRLTSHPSIIKYFPDELVVDLICKSKLFKGKVLLPDIPDSFLDLV
jgi:5'-3' exonuclease